MPDALAEGFLPVPEWAVWLAAGGVVALATALLLRIAREERRDR